MRVLLDECLPRRLKGVLEGHDVETVPERGWAGKKNGELLELAAAEFDVFVTVDQNLRYQQSLRSTSVAVVVLATRSNRFDDLLPLVPRLLGLLRDRLEPGTVSHVGGRP